MGNRTFTIIKPNAVAQGDTGKIIDRLISAGFRIIALKLVCMSRNTSEKFYSIHFGKPFYDGLIDFMSSGPAVVALLEGEDAVAKLRSLVGNTDPAKADEDTIRKLYGIDVRRNAIHASDSDENAIIEARWFFDESEIIIARYKE